MTFWQATWHDPTAVATLVLALVTCAAIVVPVVQYRREMTKSRERARRELVSLLSAVEAALETQTREPAWSASAGSDIVTARILSGDLLDAIPPALSVEVVEGVMQAQRCLHNEDIRAQAVRVQQGFQGIQDAASKARAALALVRDKIPL